MPTSRLRLRVAMTQQARGRFLRWQAHLLEWGMRCIVTRVFTLVVLLAYQWQLSRIAGEHGGTHTAYFYDVAMGQKARSVMRGWRDARAPVRPYEWLRRPRAPWNRGRVT